jgi:hypothetical protein
MPACARPKCRATFATGPKSKKYCSRQCKGKMEQALRHYAQVDVDSGRTSLRWVEDQFDADNLLKGKSDA